jgi:hypothetical protein
VKPTRARLLKTLLVSVGVFLGLVLISAVILVLLFPKERITALVAEEAGKIIRREVTISELTLGFHGLRAREVSVHEGPSTDDPLLLSAGAVEMAFDLSSLLDRKFIVHGLYLEDVELNLRFDDQEITNVEKLIRDLQSGDDTSTRAEMELSRISFQDLVINVINAPADPFGPLGGTWKATGKLHLPGGDLLEVRDTRVHLPAGGAVLANIDITTGGEKGFSIRGTADLENAEITWTYRWAGERILPFNRATGRVNDLFINDHQVSGNADLTSVIQGSPHSAKIRGFYRVDWEKETVEFSGTNVTFHQSSLLLSKMLYNYETEYLLLEGTSKGVTLADLGVPFPELPKKLSGTLSGNFDYQDGIISGKVALQNLSYGRGDPLVRDLSLETVIHKNEFRVENVPLVLMGNRGKVSLAATGGKEPKIYCNLTMPDFAPPSSDDKKKTAIPGVNVPLPVSGRITLGRLRAESWTLEDLTLDYSLKGSSVNVRRFSAEGFGGSIYGKGEVNLSSTPMMKSFISLKQVKLQRLTDRSKELKNRVFGILTGRGTLELPLKNISLETITGSFQFQVDQGKIVDTGIQDGLGLLLSEMRHKLRDLEFSSITGDADISSGMIRINSFRFEAPEIRMRMNGSMTTKLEARPSMDLHLYFTRRFIQDLPQPAVTLMGLEKYYSNGWFHLPFIIRGDITRSGNISRVE